MEPKRNYSTDRKWADLYIPACKKLCGFLALEEAPFDVDVNEATDLIVMTTKKISIGCRFRQEGYAARFPHDVTFRLSRPTGSKTEFEKIKEGFCSHYFYGHVNIRGGFSKYFILDMDKFRENLKNNPEGLKRGMRVQKNPDGTKFLPFDVRNFDEGVLIS